MTKFKYPAPFDPPHVDIVVKGAPFPPSHCGPPLPVGIPVDSPLPIRKRSLYRELFGEDLSMLVDIYDALWASPEQRLLAAKLLGGEVSINTLSTQEADLLDGLAIDFNHQGGVKNESKDVRQAVRKRLPVPDDDESRENRREEMRAEPELGVPSGVSPGIAGAYGWISGEEEGGQ